MLFKDLFKMSHNGIMEDYMSLLDMIKEAGIVGAGGAGFPTHAKLASKAQKRRKHPCAAKTLPNSHPV
jgi:Na+-translocating ferredoxin:NAD+ oxidoreductase RnfC subunit